MPFSPESKPPLILSFDTSSSVCTVALTCGEDVLGLFHEEMARGQAEALLVICQNMMADAGRDLAELDALGVGIGPGNFTGIRISVSAARGLALGLGIPVVGVSTFEALKHGTSGACGCAVNARRAHIYLQTFDDAGNPSAPTLVSAQALPVFEGPLIGEGGRPSDVPHAVAICSITATRFRSGPPRPAPLYLRPADAAPARDAPPMILK